MDDRDSDPLKFRGQDATECEDFITAVLKCAFTEGKQRDDQWMADFAATCMTNDALRWWSALDEEVQGSWKQLRRGMLSRYRPIFQGGSGEEAEKFVRVICDKAIDEGKQEDNKWIATYASYCLAGEALRWYAYLDSDTQENWKKLRQALLTQYPRAGTVGPPLNLVPTPPAAVSRVSAPRTTCRGRIRVSRISSSTTSYLSKCLPSDGRLVSTSSVADALELEWSTNSDGPQTLSIPGSQITGYNLLGVKWNSHNKSFLAFCAVDAETNSTSLSSYTGPLLTENWNISAGPTDSDGIMSVSVVDGTEILCPRAGTTCISVYFSLEKDYADRRADFFFEPV